MSLVNSNDLIIPNTVGVITSAVKEANRHIDKYRENCKYQEIKNKDIAEYIREIPQIQFVLQNRINGVPLNQLVDSSRISNEQGRAMGKEENARQQNMVEQLKNQRVYEDWFNE